MHDPTQVSKADQPYKPANQKVQQRFEQPPLHQLPKARNKEAADGSEDIPGGTFSGRWRQAWISHVAWQSRFACRRINYTLMAVL